MSKHLCFLLFTFEHFFPYQGTVGFEGNCILAVAQKPCLRHQTSTSVLHSGNWDITLHFDLRQVYVQPFSFLVNGAGCVKHNAGVAGRSDVRWDSSRAFSSDNAS